MNGRRTRTRPGNGRGTWLMLLILLAAILVPTTCVVWFMSAAMGNERLAVRQRLTDVYRQALLRAKDRFEQHWAGKTRALENAAVLLPPKAFADLVRAGVVDSVVLYDRSGRAAYPADEGQWSEAVEHDEGRGEAERLEANGDFAPAAEAYGRIADEQGDMHAKARALQAGARCLAKAGMTAGAVEVLADTLAAPEYQVTRDAWGRLIAPDGLLLALRLCATSDEQRQAIADDLGARLSRYDGPAMPSAQRLFLMRQWQKETGQTPATLAAEQMAADYLAADALHPTGPDLQPVKSIGLWTLPSADGRAVALYTDQTVAGVAASIAQGSAPIAGASVTAHHGPPAGDPKPFLTMSAGETMPDWNLSLYLDDPDPFAAAAAHQNAVHLWVGGAGVVAIAAIGATVAAYLGRQIRLTRLKNDLIATVSHELKTPLSSMRVLVDTLREGRCTGDRQAREYFDLIARENERLSRLIDNFLTFSRMERNKRTFEFAPVDMAAVVRSAVEAVGERFAGPHARLAVDVGNDLPMVLADRDAMVAVVLNLLDNAWKYTGEHKAVGVRTFSADGGVGVEVSDNGAGMSRRAVRRIFDKFYQADRRLSQHAGGCGLGLSIVKFILDAHDGSIGVASQPGKGSTFTVRLPAVSAGSGRGSEVQKHVG